MKKAILLAVIFLCSCGRSDEKVCEPGRQAECACSGSINGYQVCLADGSGWGECECGCLKDCTNRECGPDPVCGESCGSCRHNEACSGEGRCECEFLDCYGFCCAEGQVCHGGSCCTPECTDRVCGPDTFCGESCGSCPENMTCSDDGDCECTYLDCDGICCDDGQVCSSGSCCTPDCNGRDCGLDPACGASCGECINECTGSEDPALCVDSVCQQVCCPTTCNLLGVNCGVWDDGCGGIIECGDCGPNEYCRPRTGECECRYEACEGVCCGYDEVCHAGSCCLPDCTGRQCGDDGCGGVCWQCNHCKTCNPDGECVGGCESAGTKALMPTGGPIRTLYPGERENLQVYLWEGTAGETVDFEIVGYGFGSTLSAASAVTSEEKLAAVTLTAGQPGAQNRQFHVWAHHPEVPEGTYFYILLKPEVGRLDDVGGLDSRCYVNDSIELKVKLLDADRNTPIEGVNIDFYLVNPPSGGDSTLQDSHVVTDRLGLASTMFHAGTLERQYQVIVEGAMQNVGRVTFNVSVMPHQPCQVSSDCLDGYVCAGGECRPEGLLPETCDTSSDCPAGYFCENHQCYPCPENSQDPQCQGQSCITNEECPPGLFCRNGICYPDNDPDVDIPGLGGAWRTKYYLDMSESTGGLSTVGIINTLNQIANNCNITGIGWVDDVLCDTAPVSTADWVDVLIDIMANLPNILCELRAEGEMAAGNLTPRELLSFSEKWDIIHVRYLNACCYDLGNPTSCNPYEHPEYPECADVAIPVEELEAYQDVLQIDSFTGKVRAVDSGGTYSSTLAVDSRQIKIEYTKFVTFLVDRMVQMFIGYNNLDDALMDIQDCVLMQCVVDCLLGSWAPNIIQACENMKPSAASLMRSMLDQIGEGWKIIRLNGWATVTAEGDPLLGTSLGFPDYETGGDGYLDGSCTIVLSGDVRGAWYGER